MNNSGRRTLVCAAITVTMTAAACTASTDPGSGPDARAGSGTGTISVWAHQGQEAEVEALQKAVADFNAVGGGVTAELRLIPEADYPRVVASTPPADLPDVLEFDGPTMASLVFNGKLAPLTEFIGPATVDNATDSIKAQGTAGQTLYGLGMFDSGLGLYGNRKLLDAAGVDYPTDLAGAWTAEEFASALDTLAAKDEDGKVLDLKENYGFAAEWGTYAFSPAVWSAGGQFMRDGKATGAVNGPEAVAALRTVASWKPFVDPNTDDGSFATGKVALSWVGHWAYPDYAEALGDDLVVIPLPDLGTGPKTGQGSWAWGIGAGTNNAAAGGKFLDFLLGDGPVKAMAAANGAPPGTKSVLAASDLYGPDGDLALFAAQLAKPCGTDPATAGCVAVTRPVTAGYPVITEQFHTAFAAVWGGADPQAALDTAAAEIDREFADNDGFTLP